jgi:nitrosocyanin
MNKIFFTLPIILAVFISGCVGQPPEANETTTTTTTETPTGTLVATNTATTAPTFSSGEIREFTIRERSFVIVPNTITVNRGDRVRITIMNTGGGAHDIFIDGYNIKSDTINSGQTVVEFTADTAGTFDMWCTVENHKDLGMVGQFIVQ